MKLGNEIKKRTAKRNNVGGSIGDEESEENEGAEQFISVVEQSPWQEATSIIARKGFIKTVRT